MDIFIGPELYKYYQRFPIRLVDVGASGGIKNNWKPAEKFLKIIGFEPCEEAFNNLLKSQTSKTKYLNIGLYKEKAIVDFYITKNRGATSIFVPNKTFLNKFPETENFDVL